MRLRDTIIRIVCVILAIAMLIAASGRLDGIHKAREEMNLVSNPALENAPPALAFATVAMGAFRGLVVDILWMRAENLKQEGQFFDAKQIADWITTLQPRFAAVWDFQGWNMAYNISVAIPADQWAQRWMWVQNGYELIRDEGIAKNPHAIILYRSLAWIFQHKIGGVTDDCHKHYKRELAMAMRRLVRSRDRYDIVTQQDFKDLMGAPKTLEEFFKDPAVAKLVADLKVADEKFSDPDELAETYLAMLIDPGKFDPAAFEVLDAARQTGTIDKLDLFARSYVLRNVWKFDIELMYQLNEKYGPASLDNPDEHDPMNWEHPDTHAIYWAELGLMRAGKHGSYSVDEKNTDRIVFHSLQKLYRMGKIIVYPIPGELPSVYLRPDLRMFDVCNRAWIEKIEKYEAMENSNPKAVRGGHKNMLENAAVLFYQAGHKEKAGQIYTQLREMHKLEAHNIPLRTFVQRTMREEIKDLEIHDATELLLMSLREAYFRYAIGDDEEAFGNESWARELHKHYVDIFSDEKVRRVDLPSFEMVRYMALRDFLADPYYPQNLKNNVLGRIKVERPDLFEKLTLSETEFMELQKQRQQEEESK